MFLNFPFKAAGRAAFEARARAQGWIDRDGNPLSGLQIAYLGRKIVTPATYDEHGNVLTGAVVSDYDRVDVRLHGEKAREETRDLPQTDRDGRELPLRERTRFGRWMRDNGVEEIGPDPARRIEQPEGAVWLLYEDQVTPDHEWQ